jgi:membrane-bound ClpP family serine protease
MDISFRDTAPVMLALLLSTTLYDRYVVDIIERTHPNPGVTAYEVVGGVMIVLTFYLILVRDTTLTGIASFMLLLTLFCVGGIPMILGSHHRSLAPVK